MKTIFWKFGHAIFYFEEGPFAGQTIVWFGEPLGDGSYLFYPNGAKIIHSIPEEQVKTFFISALKGLKVIRKLNEDEYPALRATSKNLA